MMQTERFVAYQAQQPRERHGIPPARAEQLRGTVKQHTYALHRALGVASRTAMIAGLASRGAHDDAQRQALEKREDDAALGGGGVSRGA